jgi:hypothetical protein
VVSVGGKLKANLEWVSIRETNESEPFEDSSLMQIVVGDRRIGGVNRMQAFARNCRNQSLRCQGRSSSGEQPQGESPDAEHWGGPIRISDEGS